MKTIIAVLFLAAALTAKTVECRTEGCEKCGSRDAQPSETPMPKKADRL